MTCRLHCVWILWVCPLSAQHDDTSYLYIVAIEYWHSTTTIATIMYLINNYHLHWLIQLNSYSWVNINCLLTSNRLIIKCNIILYKLRTLSIVLCLLLLDSFQYEGNYSINVVIIIFQCFLIINSTS